MTSLIHSAHLGFSRHRCRCCIVVDGVAQILHVVDELVPPGSILSDGGYLLGGGNGVLHLPQAVEVFTLFLCHLQLESGHLLVFGFCHGLGSGFQSFARNLQGLTDPRGRRDTDGNADDAQEFHHVHAAPSEHHHPALVGAYTERQQQADDACQSVAPPVLPHSGRSPWRPAACPDSRQWQAVRWLREQTVDSFASIICWLYVRCFISVQ